jgi:UDP-GlcNAc:undecaprenyl-phosphate/decaprenyl-phosphate GlcNAc-1-phosphate transferase
VNTFFVIFLIATTASLISTPLIRRLCERYALLDVPDGSRRVHRRAVPRLGGVALFVSCAVALSALPFVDNLLTQSLRTQMGELLCLLIPSALVLLLGIYDDLWGTNAVVKLVVLGLIATLFFVMGGRIDALSIPLAGSVHLPIVLSFVITVLWLVGIANAFNLIDGLDGLASGAALFSSLVILAISIAQGRSLSIVIALVLCGALAGFLRYNFNPASIFLGDSGALFVGFTLAGLSVLSTQKATTAVAIVVPILAFAFPMVDTAMTMGRRLISKRPIFEGDKEHIHHMLLAYGWSQRRVALALYGVCAAFGLVAMLSTTTGSKMTGFAMFVVTVAILIAVGHLRYHEVDEIRAGVKRTVADRRLRVANNIRVRRTARSLSKASDLHEIFETVRQMLDFGEFTFANAQVGRVGYRDLNEHAMQTSAHRSTQEQLELRNGRIYWSWPGEGSEGEDVLRSRSSWCFRLSLVKNGVDWGWMNFYRSHEGGPLLVDTDYLGDLFRRELTNAMERVLRVEETPRSIPDIGILFPTSE